MKKVALISLGCSKNLVDSELILGQLVKEEYVPTSSLDEADLIIVNTCGFILKAKKEAIKTILNALTYHKPVVVTGCLAERYFDELKKALPEVALFIPIRDYKRFNELLKTVDKDIPSAGGLNEKDRFVSTGPFSAYLKIGDGCSNRCSYCAIPLIRGEFVSRPYEDIIDEAKRLAKSGIKEIIVLQQDTTKYGIDLKNGENIVSLLKGLLAIKEFEYIRLLYLYPDEISDELIELIAKEKRLTPYFDIPIQHSETNILKAMHRRGDKGFLRQLFSKIRNRVPNAILRTTLMVGFPGETEEDFNNLKAFIKEIGFDHLGAFTYSREEDTPAYSFKNQIPEKTKRRRLKEIMTLQQEISYQKNQAHVGEIMEGLIVGYKGKRGLFRSYFNAPDDVDGQIFVTGCRLPLGTKTKVLVKKAGIYDLYGVIAE